MSISHISLLLKIGKNLQNLLKIFFYVVKRLDFSAVVAVAPLCFEVL